ncbi:MAG: tRNA (guanosine(46)-N7)-methyltransferase TrmB [Woeseiaceae bacterium]|nr:tRNA (guanosine(46)-N7)-methyltransferase TrmB [Woeseiaceae bacterium]
MTDAQRRALDELWPRFGIDFCSGPIDLDAAFGRAAPRVLEIGFGNGDTLVAQARLDPASDFLGIEVHEPGVGHCLIAARDAGIDNLRVIVHDAIEVLEAGIGTGTLTRINLYFPDPWPKKRHHKRRIVTLAFLELCASRLAAGGSLNIATDWAGYAEHIDETVAASPHFTCAERREHAGDRPLDRPVTKFEQRGQRAGHRIVDWRLDRTAD